MMSFTSWRTLTTALVITIALSVTAYLGTPQGVPVLLFGLSTWFGGLVVEAILRKRAERRGYTGRQS